MSCRDHHNWVVMSPRPLSRLWTWRHLDQVESRLAKGGIWTRSRGLWLVESTSGQWMQVHPTDAVRIRKNRKITDAPTQAKFHATLWGTWQSPPSPLLMAAATFAATAITMRVRRIWTKRIYHIQGNPRGADLSVEFANMAMTTTSRHNQKWDFQTMWRKALGTDRALELTEMKLLSLRGWRGASPQS